METPNPWKELRKDMEEEVLEKYGVEVSKRGGDKGRRDEL